MVAPTRAPQARGVKCDLCKKLLAQASWLDQTKPAKAVEDAKSVLDLIHQHNKTECPCIPKNILNLLVGSTHFEIHRLVARALDQQVHKKQSEYLHDARQKEATEQSKNQNENINDCHDTRKTSRFKLYVGHNDQKHCERSKQMLKHLSLAIDFWRTAMEDVANPFNSKLALRLGLTHHVIYACYLFKYHRIIDYQLLTVNLLVNLFKSIEGVTANALLHANYLLVRTLMDCNQYQLARHTLKEATKMQNYDDKSHYESILLTCVSCEMSLLDGDNNFNILDELAGLAVIQSDDKLQHYYARTLALSTVIKFIHHYPARSDFCFEFYHTFRYICAIIRRCYDSSFELIMATKDLKQSKRSQEAQQNQILDHSWIRFAACDYVFTTFDLLTGFYSRAGQPESLELVYNALNLITYRNGSCYWQARMASIGASLDVLCDKYDHGKVKLDAMSRIIGHTNDPHLMNLLRLDLEVGLLSLLDRQDTVIKKEIILDLLERLRTCRQSMLSRVTRVELYDCKSNSTTKTSHNSDQNSSFATLGNNFGNISLRALKAAVLSLVRTGNSESARDLVHQLGQQLSATDCEVLEYNDCQMILEILLCFADINQSDQILLDSAGNGSIFLESEDSLSRVESQLSMLTIGSESTTNTEAPKGRATKSKPKISRPSIGRRSKHKGCYNVAGRSLENLHNREPVRYFNTVESVKNFSSLTKEEIAVSYLRNSEPNPDFLLYRKAHELMFSFRSRDAEPDHNLILYHFCESNSANTMRYRWMMFEELQVSPYDNPKLARYSASRKHLGFSNVLVNPEKIMRSMLRGIPDDYRLVQIKFIMDKQRRREHLLIVSFDGKDEAVYVHASKSISADDFFEDAKLDKSSNQVELSLPQRLSGKIEEAKRTLFYNNQRSRSEIRQRLETEVGVILHDLENDWLGAFRFLLCGKILDKKYCNFVQKLVQDILEIMHEFTCQSTTALRMFLENAPLLNRDEFCQVISLLFGCPSTSSETRDSFNKWLKSMEIFVAEQAGGDTNKSGYLQALSRGQLGLILDSELESVPLESLPIVRINKQGIFRIPSMRLFNAISNRSTGSHPTRVDTTQTVYILDPASNLSKTRERFEAKLRAQKGWSGTISEAPEAEQLEQWLTDKQVYLFIGHGAGTVYYNKLCKGRGLSAMGQVGAVCIVMGCSSGRVLAEGPKLEPFGIGWVFVLRGSPAYVGLLWDVTDTDIDRFLDALLARWMSSTWTDGADSCGRTGVSAQVSRAPKRPTRAARVDTDGGGRGGHERSECVSLTEAVSQARHVCQFKILVGSTPVVYGLPIWCGGQSA